MESSAPREFMLLEFCATLRVARMSIMDEYEDLAQLRKKTSDARVFRRGNSRAQRRTRKLERAGWTLYRSCEGEYGLKRTLFYLYTQ